MEEDHELRHEAENAAHAERPRDSKPGIQGFLQQASIARSRSPSPDTAKRSPSATG